MKILFMLPNGVIEWPVPPDANPPFHFPSFATTIRVNGFFMSDNLYLRHEQLVGISFSADDVAAPVVRGTLQ